MELVASATQNLGWLALEQADYSQAASHLSEALTLIAENENPRDLVPILELIARLALKMNRPDYTLRLVGGTAELRRQAPVVATPHQQTELDAVITEARSTLGAEAAGTLWAAGAAMTAEDLLQYSLKAIQEIQGDTQTTQRGSPQPN